MLNYKSRLYINCLLFQLLVFALNFDLSVAFAETPVFAQTPAETSPGGVLYVQVQSAKLRKSPQQWAQGIMDLKFGDKLELLENQSVWLRVKSLSPSREAQDQQGYLHSSAVTVRKVLLSASVDDMLNAKVDEQDVYLAGKGFNDDVVQSYATAEPKANFAAVKAMKMQPKPEGAILHDFIESGKLSAS